MAESSGTTPKKARKSTSESAAKQPGVEEARRVRSREAAKTRRDQENQEIFNLSQLIPVPSHVVDSLDKSTILRLAFSYLRVKAFVGNNGRPSPFMQDPATRTEVQSEAQASVAKQQAEGAVSVASTTDTKSPPKPINVFTQSSGLLSALRGFLMVVSGDGCVTYCSSNIRTMLGIRDVEVMGNNLSDFVQPEDYHFVLPHLKRLYQDGLARMETIGGKKSVEWAGPAEHVTEDTPVAEECAFSIRMKCNNEKKTSNKTASSHASMVASNKTFSYELVRIVGQYEAPAADPSFSMDTTLSLHSMVLVCRPVNNNVSMQPIVGSMAFRTRHNLDFSFVECCEKVEMYTDYSPSYLIGKSLYSVVHPEDAKQLQDKHRELIGESEDVVTLFLRYMLANGDNLWVEMVASVARSPKTSRPMSILATNYVVSVEPTDQWHSMGAEWNASKHCYTQKPQAPPSSSSPATDSTAVSSASQSTSAANTANTSSTVNAASIKPSTSFNLPLTRKPSSLSNFNSPMTSSSLVSPTLPFMMPGLATRPGCATTPFSEYRGMLASNQSVAGDLVLQSYLSETGQSESEALTSAAEGHSPPAKRPHRRPEPSVCTPHSQMSVALPSAMSASQGSLGSANSVFQPNHFFPDSVDPAASSFPVFHHAQLQQLSASSPMLTSQVPLSLSVGLSSPVPVASSPAIAAAAATSLLPSALSSTSASVQGRQSVSNSNVASGSSGLVAPSNVADRRSHAAASRTLEETTTLEQQQQSAAQDCEEMPPPLTQHGYYRGLLDGIPDFNSGDYSYD